MNKTDFHLVGVVVFFFISAASRKSYLVQLDMRKRGSGMQGEGQEGGSNSLFTRTMKGVPLYRIRWRSDKLLEFIRSPRF